MRGTACGGASDVGSGSGVSLGAGRVVVMEEDVQLYPPVLPKTGDVVNHPPHYTTGQIECLDYILDQQLNYCAGQVVKYVTRYRYKGQPVQDLQKAHFYLKRLLRDVQAEEDGSMK